jgi:hypothetical protein
MNDCGTTDPEPFTAYVQLLIVILEEMEEELTSLAFPESTTW